MKKKKKKNYWGFQVFDLTLYLKSKTLGLTQGFKQKKNLRQKLKVYDIV